MRFKEFSQIMYKMALSVVGKDFLLFDYAFKIKPQIRGCLSIISSHLYIQLVF